MAVGVGRGERGGGERGGCVCGWRGEGGEGRREGGEEEEEEGERGHVVWEVLTLRLEMWFSQTVIKKSR